MTNPTTHRNFLAELRAEHGTWSKAVDRHHSSKPARRRDYVCKVYITLATLQRRKLSTADWACLPRLST